MNNKRTKRCIDCGNELLSESDRNEDVVCEDCLVRIKRQFWASVNIEMTDKKPWMKKKEKDELT
jgi:NMD protein affecting ribosome stability and mRNA decay